MVEDIFILSAARTAIGDFGGALKEFAPAELGRIVMEAAIERAAIQPDLVGHVVMGQVMPSGPQDAYLARVCAVNAGVPVHVPAFTLNRLCGSGVQAIISAGQLIKLGEADFAIAGGAESMSRVPHIVSDARFGRKMGSVTMVDGLTEALHDPFGRFHMGVTAENIAKRNGIDRARQDALAVESHARAAKAISEGRFRDQIVPIDVKKGRNIVTFDKDEHVRQGTTVDDLAKLRPAFDPEGSVTAGNASGINDGAAALVLASGSAVRANGLKARARIVSWGYAGVEPSLMGLGPICAVPEALAAADLTLGQMDVIESNEAFAAQAYAVAQELGLDPAKTNVNGSGISLGHPVGATGAILTVKAVHELERVGGRYGLITMCIGGGQGIALIIERV